MKCHFKVTVCHSWSQITVTSQAFEILSTYGIGHRVTVYSIKKRNNYINMHAYAHEGIAQKIKNFLKDEILNLNCDRVTAFINQRLMRSQFTFQTVTCDLPYKSIT
jgi:hypothetical protein